VAALVARLALLLIFSVTFLGCGSSEDRAPAKIPVGFSARTVTNPKLSIALPKQWRSFDAGSSRGAKDAPGLSSGMRAELELLSRPDTPIKLIGLAPTAPRTFVANMNVLQTRVPSSLSFDQLAETEARQIRRATHARDMRQDETRLPAGRALRLRYRAQSGAVIHQYFVRHEKFLYILTYTTSPARAAHYAKIFDLSAHTFQIG
jgi:hypothetical protein